MYFNVYNEFTYIVDTLERESKQYGIKKGGRKSEESVNFIFGYVKNVGI